MAVYNIQKRIDLNIFIHLTSYIINLVYIYKQIQYATILSYNIAILAKVKFTLELKSMT